MARRSPARFLAPLALVAVLAALFTIVSSSPTSDEDSGPNQATEARPTATPDGEPERERKGPRRYTVKPGDTPSAIAEETGVPLDQLLRLNPDVDPQTLSPGTRLRLRQ